MQRAAKVVAAPEVRPLGARWRHAYCRALRWPASRRAGV